MVLHREYNVFRKVLQYVVESLSELQAVSNKLYSPSTIVPQSLQKETKIEPCHEIMVLFVLRKLILQTLMRSRPVGLDV